MEFAQIYRDDLPEMESLKAEMDIWGTYWLQEFSGKLPHHISTTLKETVMMNTTFGRSRHNSYHYLSVNVRYLLCVTLRPTCEVQ